MVNAEKILKEINRESASSVNDREKYENKLEEAFVMLSSACNKNANISRAFFLRGKCYYHMGDF